MCFLEDCWQIKLNAICPETNLRNRRYSRSKVIYERLKNTCSFASRFLGKIRKKITQNQKEDSKFGRITFRTKKTVGTVVLIEKPASRSKTGLVRNKPWKTIQARSAFLIVSHFILSKENIYSRIHPRKGSKFLAQSAVYFKTLLLEEKQ